MTINECEELLKEFSKKFKDEDKAKNYIDMKKSTLELWDNEACKGYTIQAMRESGYSDKDIEKVLIAFYSIFDTITVDQAQQIYKEY